MWFSVSWCLPVDIHDSGLIWVQDSENSCSLFRRDCCFLKEPCSPICLLFHLPAIFAFVLIVPWGLVRAVNFHSAVVTAIAR